MNQTLLECLQTLRDDELAMIVYHYGNYQPSINIRKFNDSIYVCEWDGFPSEELSLQNYHLMYCMDKIQLPMYTPVTIVQAKSWYEKGKTIAWEQDEDCYIDIDKNASLPTDIWLSNRLAIKNY